MLKKEHIGKLEFIKVNFVRVGRNRPPRVA